MSEPDCVFCKIVRGEIEAKVVHDEDGVLAFEDIRGRAPVHVLVIPKQHVSNLEGIGALPDAVFGRLFAVASAVAEKSGVAGSGYAVRINNGPNGGQVIHHLHLHVLGGAKIPMTGAEGAAS